MNWIQKKYLELFTAAPRPIATNDEVKRFKESPCLIAIQQRAAQMTDDAIRTRTNPDAPHNKSDIALGMLLALDWLLDDNQLTLLLTRATEADVKRWQEHQTHIRALRKALTNGS